MNREPFPQTAGCAGIVRRVFLVVTTTAISACCLLDGGEIAPPPATPASPTTVPDIEATELAYVREIRSYRTNPGQSATLLKARYDGANKDSYFERWEIVHRLSDLARSEAFPALREIALEPISRPTTNANHYAPGKYDEEMMIRFRAIGGLALLARKYPGGAARPFLEQLLIEGPEEFQPVIAEYILTLDAGWAGRIRRTAEGRILQYLNPDRRVFPSLRPDDSASSGGPSEPSVLPDPEEGI